MRREPVSRQNGTVLAPGLRKWGSVAERTQQMEWLIVFLSSP